MLTYAAAILATTVVLSADPPKKQGDFEILRPMLGTWEVQDFEYEGEVLYVQVTWKLVLDGRFIESKWYSANKDTGEIITAGLDMIGRDPSDGKLKFWEFYIPNGFCQLVLEGVDGTLSTWSHAAIEADGRKEGGKVTFETIDRNRYNWSLVVDDSKS